MELLQLGVSVKRFCDILLQINLFLFGSGVNENLNEIFVPTGQFNNRKLLVLPKF